MIAHELTHVVQQNGNTVQRAEYKSNPTENMDENDPYSELIEDDFDDVIKSQLPHINKYDTLKAKVSVTKYETGKLTKGPVFEHIYFSDGSMWSTKILSSGRHVYLDIRSGLHKGEGYTVPDSEAYKAQEVKNWLLGLHPDLKEHWTAYREKATKK